MEKRKKERKKGGVLLYNCLQFVGDTEGERDIVSEDSALALVQLWKE